VGGLNKALNTIFFLIGATILNLSMLIVLALVIGALLGSMYRKFDINSQAMSLLAVILILLGAVLGTFFLYSRLIKWVIRRWNLDTYIKPVFRKRRGRV